MSTHALDDGLRPAPGPTTPASPTPTPASLRAQRLSPALGATVDAGDLAAAGPDGPTLLRRLVRDHHVVFVRGFGRDERRFRELATSFGPLTVHPLQRFTGREQPVTVIEDTPEHPPAAFPWHTDLSWLEAPPRFGLLQALEIPPSGGDTLWTSLVAAHAALSPPVQRLCATLTAWHRVDATLRRTVVDRHGAELAGRFEAAHPPVRHPLVRAHPDTGAPVLFVCPMYLDRIEELHPDESDVLLSHLHDVAVDPHRSVRWRWSEGDLAVWDEACTLHRALGDHHPSVRRMRRCTTEGERPRPAAGPAGAGAER
ncbi:MAG TPA: TauD/TfdA family dioxygenase [Acidimicrobiales bacterium]